MFKEIVEKEISTVFLNLKEFAQTHLINGQEKVCVTEQITATEKEPNTSGYVKYEGVHRSEKIIYIEASELEEVPIEGEILYFDSEMWIVEKVTEQDGLLKIEVGGNRSG